MFRSMRRTKQHLTQEECIDILKNSTCGVLAVSEEGGYPYAVPLSHVYLDGKIYFHCGKDGHKMELIRQNEKVSFCVVAQDTVVPEEFTTDYKSVILFGKAYILEKWEEKEPALAALCKKFSPGIDAERELASGKEGVCIVAIEIMHMTGKKALRSVK